MSWDTKAACRGMDDELFFPEGRGHVAIEAFATCRRCPVRDQCLEEAIARTGADDIGIWGGTSEIDRRDIRRGHITRQQAKARGDRRSTLQHCACGVITRRSGGVCSICRTTPRKAVA